MKKVTFWLVFIALICLSVEGISRVGLFVLARSEQVSRTIKLSRVQKKTLRMFALGDLACFRPEVYTAFKSAHPGVDEMLGPIKIVEDESTCIQIEKIDDALKTRMADAFGELRKYTGTVMHSASLGWDVKPNSVQDTPFPATYNADGIRGSIEYDLSTPNRKTRIAAVGDSFTHGNDVSDTDTWTYQLERLAPNTEVLNFGMGFYGLGQSYLKYKEKVKKYNSDVVLIGYYVNNLERDVNRFRYFYAPQDPFIPTAPRFKVRNGELILIPNPVQRRELYLKLLGEDRDFLHTIGQDDFFYSRFSFPGAFDYSSTTRLLKNIYRTVWRKTGETPIYKRGIYNIDSEAFDVIKHIFNQFYHEVIDDNAVPVIVLFPSRRNLVLYREKQSKMYQPILDYFDAEKMSYVDTLDGFERYGANRSSRDFFRGHLTPDGNEVVAKTIRRALIQNGLMIASMAVTPQISPER